MPLLWFETNLGIVICENVFSCSGCCVHVFYRIAVLNILRKFQKVIHVAEPFPSTKDIRADVLLRTLKFLENLFSKTPVDAGFWNNQTLVEQWKPCFQRKLIFLQRIFHLLSDEIVVRIKVLVVPYFLPKNYWGFIFEVSNSSWPMRGLKGYLKQTIGCRTLKILDWGKGWGAAGGIITKIGSFSHDHIGKCLI